MAAPPPDPRAPRPAPRRPGQTACAAPGQTASAAPSDERRLKHGVFILIDAIHSEMAQQAQQAQQAQVVDATQCFSPQMTPDEKTSTLDLVEIFHDACQAHDVNYAMCYGTALGHKRHHGFIPWDDDVDLCVPEKDREKLLDVLSELRGTPNMGTADALLHGGGDSYKLFYKDGKQCSWFTWPFLDIFMIPDNSPDHSHLFPSRPAEQLFENRLTLQEPHDSDAHLTHWYGDRYMQEYHDDGDSHRLEQYPRQCATRTAADFDPILD